MRVVLSIKTLSSWIPISSCISRDSFIVQISRIIKSWNKREIVCALCISRIINKICLICSYLILRNIKKNSFFFICLLLITLNIFSNLKIVDELKALEVNPIKKANLLVQIYKSIQVKSGGFGMEIVRVIYLNIINNTNEGFLG